MTGSPSPRRAAGQAAAARVPRALRLLRRALAGSALPGVLAAQGIQGAPASRAQLLNPDDIYWAMLAPDTVRARFETTRGAFVVEAYRQWAPRGVDRFYNLVRSGFFDDSRFYRVLPNYIAQFGIPGDPAVARAWEGRAIPDDPPAVSNARGTFAFAMRGPNDRRTQLYINLADNRRNDADGFAILGRVVEGMDVVDRLYGGYGESAGGGMRGGNQGRIFAEGNAHLDRDFPKLDRITRATVVAARGAQNTPAIARGGRTLDQLFAGRFPGVSVTAGPNGGLQIRIRGGSTSFMGGEEPLYIVDGTPLPQAPNGIVFLNPYDIEKIQVLKNPADVSVYGVRGANGVILITTIRPGPR